MTTAEILARAGVSREELGARVREAWTAWAARQPDPKPSWLVPFSQLSPADREADMMIGEELFCTGWEAREATAGGSAWVVRAEAYADRVTGWGAEAVFSGEDEAVRYASMGDMTVDGPFTVDSPFAKGRSG